MDNKKLQGKIRTMIIGAFTVGGLAIAVWAIFFFKPSVGDSKNRLTIRFSNIENIDVGTRVTYAGRPVGEVIEINQLLNARSERNDQYGRPFTYEVIIALDSSVQIYDTDLIEMHTSGLLGEKSIAIIPMAFPENTDPKSVIGKTMYAESTDPLASTLKSVADASEQISRTMSNISEVIETNQEQINSSIENLNSTLEQASNMLYQVNQLDMIGSFNRAAMDISKLMNNSNQLVEQLRTTNTVEKVNTSLTQLSQIMQSITDGKGTLGKLINDPTLYLEAVGLIERANILISDLNNYGLLFHRSARWKQKQKERQAYMDNLNSPDQFKQALENKMDKINISLEKVNAMIEKAEAGDKEIVDSNEFKTYFYQLLNEVNRLQNLIEMYNLKVTSPS